MDVWLIYKIFVMGVLTNGMYLKTLSTHFIYGYMVLEIW